MENRDALLLLDLNRATGGLSPGGSSQLLAAAFAAFILLSTCHEPFQFFELTHRIIQIITAFFG